MNKKVVLLNEVSELMSEHANLSLEDFYSVGIWSTMGVLNEVKLSYSSRFGNHNFSDILKQVEHLARLSMIDEYSCDYDKEHRWFNVKMIYTNEVLQENYIEPVKIEMTIH